MNATVKSAIPGVLLAGLAAIPGAVRQARPGWTGVHPGTIDHSTLNIWFNLLCLYQKYCTVTRAAQYIDWAHRVNGRLACKTTSLRILSARKFRDSRHRSSSLRSSAFSPAAAADQTPLRGHLAQHQPLLPPCAPYAFRHIRPQCLRHTSCNEYRESGIS